jgi:hypothetical protein
MVLMVFIHSSGFFMFLGPSKAYSTGSSTSATSGSTTMPPTMTEAKGRWVSLPTPVDRAMGSRPSSASKATK